MWFMRFRRKLSTTEDTEDTETVSTQSHESFAEIAECDSMASQSDARYRGRIVGMNALGAHKHSFRRSGLVPNAGPLRGPAIESHFSVSSVSSVVESSHPLLYGRARGGSQGFRDARAHHGPLVRVSPRRHHLSRSRLHLRGGAVHQRRTAPDHGANGRGAERVRARVFAVRDSVRLARRRGRP